MATQPEDKRPLQNEGRFKTVTLKDIAKVAGVTSMTVSRVMKGEGYVAPATREMVLRIAQELNYTTNLAGRALKTGRTGAIAIVSGSLDLPYCANIIHLLDALLSASGYQMRLLHSRNDIRNLINRTNSSAVDGVIVAGHHELFEELRADEPQIGQPCVFVGIVKPTGMDHIYSNLAPAVEEALELMMDAGRKRIAFVGIGSQENNTHVEIRPRTYISVMQKVGRNSEIINASDSYDVTGPQRVQNLKAYFRAHGCPDGLLCVNDDVAIQTYRALMDMGYRIPQDTLLVGCDGLPIMEYFEPPLSTIAQSMEEMCVLSWKFLQNRMANPAIEIQEMNFDATLVVRRSLTG